MITTKELIEQETDNALLELHRYGVQHDKNGKSYIYEQFPSKEEVIDSFLVCVNDEPYDDVSDADTIPEEEENRMIEESKAMISELYDNIKEIRERFIKDRVRQQNDDVVNIFKYEMSKDEQIEFSNILDDFVLLYENDFSDIPDLTEDNIKDLKDEFEKMYDMIKVLDDRFLDLER